MKITNKFGLPLNLDRFQMRKPNDSTLSVSRLVDSPQIPYLTTKNWDNLEVDVSDMLHQLRGQGMHSVLEGHVPDNAMVEEDIAIDVQDIKLTGRTDLYQEDPVTQKGTITDWKATSVFAVLKSIERTGNPVKEDWVRRLNVYAYMFKKMGYDVEKLKVWIWLNDWSPSTKQRSGPEYPPVMLVGYDVPLWPLADADAYVQTRVAIHKVARSTGVYTCSDEERWKSADSYAVMEPGRKSAVAVFGEETLRGGGLPEAELFLAEAKKKNLVMQVRKGGFRRCEAYCNVRSICPQWAKDKPVQVAP